MTIREQLEQQEESLLSPLAMTNRKSAGRAVPLEPCPVRTDFQRDRDRIIHCKTFRRLKYKTQVFLDPEGDHYRTRMTHTLEVAQVARTLARALHLNEDLTEAIALGHDLGHTPFGHIGERTLNELLPEGFRHNEQSLRVVKILENDGTGLNLTYEVQDGILCHSGRKFPDTLEGQCVRRADRIAYLNADMDDALRAGVLKPFEIPRDCLHIMGETHGQRINSMILDIVENSQGKTMLEMSPVMQACMDGLREFMFERVYQDKWRAAEEERCDHLIRELFRYYSQHAAEMPEEYVLIGYRDGMDRAVADFISGMTDRYAMRLYQDLFVPRGYRS